MIIVCLIRVFRWHGLHCASSTRDDTFSCQEFIQFERKKKKMIAKCCLIYFKVYIRYITCWTLGQFSGWLVLQYDDQETRSKYYEPVLRELLRRILDRNTRVQEAACSAFSILEEEASAKELVPYLPAILNHLTRALRLYGNRNLRLLYDTLGTLAESVGPSLNEPQCIAVLMPPIIAKWNSLADTDRHLFPLLAVSFFLSLSGIQRRH